MELGAFSISLAVKDLEASRSFYEKFGFKVFAGDAVAELADLEERRSRDRAVSGDVREEHPHLQPRLGQQRPEAAPRSPTSASCSAS